MDLQGRIDALLADVAKLRDQEDALKNRLDAVQRMITERNGAIKVLQQMAEEEAPQNGIVAAEEMGE